MRPRVIDRTRTNLSRAYRSMYPSSSVPNFDLRYIPRVQGMNPNVLVCAFLLVNAGNKGDDPETIRESKEFSLLLDKLNIQASSSSKEFSPKSPGDFGPKFSSSHSSKKAQQEGEEKGKRERSQFASLVLLEVFLYMILIFQARSLIPPAASSAEQQNPSEALI